MKILITDIEGVKTNTAEKILCLCSKKKKYEFDDINALLKKDVPVELLGYSDNSELAFSLGMALGGNIAENEYDVILNDNDLSFINGLINPVQNKEKPVKKRIRRTKAEIAAARHGTDAKETQESIKRSDTKDVIPENTESPELGKNPETGDNNCSSEDMITEKAGIIDDEAEFKESTYNLLKHHIPDNLVSPDTYKNLLYDIAVCLKNSSNTEDCMCKLSDAKVVSEATVEKIKEILDVKYNLLFNFAKFN